MPKVLIVDDSPTARDLLEGILAADPDLEVIGFAENGRDAIAQAKKLKPDVITMDLNMPVMDGFDATKEIMIETPTPIVVVTATSRAAEVETAMQALRCGALNLLQKPVGPSSPEFKTMAKEVVNTVKAMAGVYVIRHRRQLTEMEPASASTHPVGRKQHEIQLITIVASTGGPPALAGVLSSLPADFPIPILVVQHMATGFIDGFVKWLDGVIDLTTKVAEDHEVLQPATVYVAPQDHHMGVFRRRIRLSDAPPIGGFRPAGTYLFEAAAETFGSGAVGVILTGMGDDGVDGLKKIHVAGGTTIAQNEETSVVYGMPRVATEAGIIDTVLPVDAIGKQLVGLIGPPHL